MYTEVIAVKKTEYITFRSTKQVKDALSQIAAPKKWTISLLVEDIILEWLQKNHPELLADTDE